MTANPAQSRRSVERLVGQWRESAFFCERVAANHASIYGKGNDIYLGHTVRAETLRQAANQLESALPNAVRSTTPGGEA